MPQSIAIVGLACIYPDARTPAELWENVLAQRRAFRRLPAERLRAEDYWSADREAPDRTYAVEAAVIEGYEFDRVGFRVVGSTFRSADLAHWLALDVASRALADAGFPEAKGLPRDTTGVLVGNTLTGEFSRANVLRLRWPYVRRVVEEALAKEGQGAEARRAFLDRLEGDYKAPFPEIGEETLAGGLSNTIAGRICNHFDLKGGGYTVDGACASSLLALANACTALTAGDLDVALAGGVDLSLDPFELVGFAKTGALAPQEMRVFDRRSAGFWPGEGCGFAALMRYDDALAQGCRIYAVIRGWGISSDGSGGITRPEPQGQIEAIRRAYRRAGFGIDTVAYCEGHGTGTAVGDAAELEVLTRARREANPDAPPAVIGSIKANIGHTKAAAGIAGFIKATLAIHTQVLPPTTGCEEPQAQLCGRIAALRVLREAQLWPPDRPLRASVSAMGFGGINAHLVLENPVMDRRQTLGPRERCLSRSSQDAELFLFSAETLSELSAQVEKLVAKAASLSQAELTDVAFQLQRELKPGHFRAAIVASWPAELAERLRNLYARLQIPHPPRFQFAESLFLGSGATPPRITFLFPGQGSPSRLNGDLWERRFAPVGRLYSEAGLPPVGDSISTRIMQPAVVTASLAGLMILNELGVTAQAAIGHSLGEITALHWAGVLSPETLLRIAHARGATMASLSRATGAMLAIAAPAAQVQDLLDSDPVTIVGFNSPAQTVVAGESSAIQALSGRVEARGWQASRLPVSHAFHTPLVAGVVPLLAAKLAAETFAPLMRPVVSTITGDFLREQEDLRALLCRQVSSPVQFGSALTRLLEVGTDLLIEVGPGSVLTGLVQDTTQVPVVALDAGGPSIKGLLQAAGATFALGASIRFSALFDGRFSRPIALDRQPKFFVNPCELAPVLADTVAHPVPPEKAAPPVSHKSGVPVGIGLASLECGVPVGNSPAPLELVRKLAAQRAELPLEAIRDDHRMLSDLHLNSITVGQVVSETARQLGLPRVIGLTDFANASVAEIARAMEELKQAGAGRPNEDPRREPPGVDVWFERFTVQLVEATRRARPAPATAGQKPQTASPARWQVFAPQDLPLAAALRERLAEFGGAGAMVCLPENPDEDQLGLLLAAARAVAAFEQPARFVLVQHGWGGSGFARTLQLETPGLTTCVVNLPAAEPKAVDWIIAEAGSAHGYTEVHYDSQGRRREPRLRLDSTAARQENFPIGRDDILLVTGGGKGIAAECALALGRKTGVRLLLLGRSDPLADKELAENLSRFAAAGVPCRYLRANVTEAGAVRAVIQEAEQAVGPVTALLHGAGVNTPQLISSLDEPAFRRSLAPKIQGLRNVLAAIDPGRLRLLVTFSSIIARAGLRGEGDYATANEWLTAHTEQFGARHPKCRCLALEWSVWSGVGMGERLGRVDSLIQQGIMPLPPDEGVRLLLESLSRRSPAVALIVTGRFGAPPTLKQSEPDLPLWRFLERKRVYYPGVELIVDAALSPDSDPYLNDHVLQTQKLFPAVLGLEAMAQVAMALTGSALPPSLEQVRLNRPVVISDSAPTTIRLAALRRGPDLVEVCLRSEESDYHVDHFRALCRFRGQANESRSADTARPRNREVKLDPRNDLYGRILFHQGRFCRLSGYQWLDAKECVAAIMPALREPWFGPYLPADLVLGDPGARDAALHAIQACIPHRRILPTGIDRLVIGSREAGPRFVRARERNREGDDFTYDVQVTDSTGEVVERWEGLHLRALEAFAPCKAWPDSLLAPYWERRLEELAPGSRVRVVLEREQPATSASLGTSEQRSTRTDTALLRALGKTERIWRRADGKPVTAEIQTFSAAHARDFTLAVAGGGVACDLEPVAARTESDWRGLLGDEQFKLAERICREQSEGIDASATRLWTALECLRKTGLPAVAGLVLESASGDGWVLLRSGGLIVATGLSTVQGMANPLVLAVAMSAGPDTPGQSALAAIQREN